MADRLDRWKEPKIITAGVVRVKDSDASEKFLALRRELNADKPTKEGGLSLLDMIGTCKELIFDIRDGQPLFHAIAYAINGSTLDIELSRIFEISASADTEQEVWEEIREVLAFAAVEEVPVYPNNSDLSKILADQHKEMLIGGFTVGDGQGGKKRLKLTRRPTDEFTDPSFLERVDCTTPLFPAEIELVKRLAMDELKRRDHAGAILAALSLAISELKGVLQSSSRNENEIQRTLTANPILLGVEYVRILPKHRLGSEFEMDYALERVTGHFDLIEIESSSLPLFTRAGNPSSHLVHAEQQVIDWLAWIEKNNPYARSHLPGIADPLGYVIIGRRSSLDESAREKLRQRNSLFRGRLILLTYDDVLDRAEVLLSHLSGFGIEPYGGKGD